MKCPRCSTLIDEHEAGRETDVCVAVVVMGWKRSDQEPSDPENWRAYPDEWYERPDSSIVENVTNVPEYSAPDGIAAAWEVVETNREMFANIAWNVTKPGYDDYWSAAFWKADQRSRWIGNADTAPLAICRAALKAVAVIQERKVMA